MARPIATVRNILLNNKNEVLLLYRADVDWWELGGGKIESESFVDAAKREQEEETGLKLEGVSQLVCVAESTGRKDKTKRYVEIILLWKKWSGDIILEECFDKYIWNPWKNLPKNLAESTKTALECLYQCNHYICEFPNSHTSFKTNKLINKEENRFGELLKNAESDY